MPPGEAAIFDWVKTSPNGEAEITKTNGTAVAKVGDDFTESIVKENKGRFFKRNLGWMLVGVAMSVIVIGGIISSGSLQDEDLFVLFATFFVSLFVGFFAYPVLSSIFSGAAFQSLIRAIMSIVFVAIFIFLGVGFLTDVTGVGIGDVMPALQRVVESYPFPFLLAGGFAMLNGLFFYLMKAPTALGRPVMDQLEGFRMYMETAEQDRLNMQAPEITAQRFEALLPYAVALDVEKPWSEAFAAALQRAHPGDADPMSHYSPRLAHRQRLVRIELRQFGVVHGGHRKRGARRCGPVLRARPASAVVAAVRVAAVVEAAAAVGDRRGAPC